VEECLKEEHLEFLEEEYENEIGNRFGNGVPKESGEEFSHIGGAIRELIVVEENDEGFGFLFLKSMKFLV